MRTEATTGMDGRETAAGQSRRLGIVLSGGGSRGIAHIGVLRALMEQGIQPDCVAGVSAGAVIGALYANGLSAAEMLDFFYQVNPYQITHMAFAKPGFLDLVKLVPDFQRYFPHDSFEGLQRKLSVLTADLLSGEPVVFDSGPLILPLLASSSVPLVFAPTEINGRWFCDGGVIDNFPASLLADRCEVILGVHVSPIREMDPIEMTTSFAVLERCLEVGMFNNAVEKFAQCDLVIRPDDLIQYGMFDTKHFREIEASGYATALRQMAAIRSLVHQRRDSPAVSGAPAVALNPVDNGVN